MTIYARPTEALAVGFGKAILEGPEWPLPIRQAKAICRNKAVLIIRSLHSLALGLPLEYLRLQSSRTAESVWLKHEEIYEDVYWLGEERAGPSCKNHHVKG